MLKILVVGQVVPAPTGSGPQIRLWHIVEALKRSGEVDIVIVSRRDSPDHEGPNTAGSVFELTTLPLPLRLLIWLVSDRYPIELSGLRRRHLHRAVRRWSSRRSYDMIWYSRASSWVACREIFLGRAVVDLDDLEHLRWRRRSEMSARSWKRVLIRAIEARNASSWAKLQEEIVANTDRVVTCSDGDATHLGSEGVAVIPNGYSKTSETRTRPVGDIPTVLFQGRLTYDANEDAVAYLVDEIFPLLEEKLPRLQLRLVGKAGRAVRALHDPPRITVTGEVPKMEPELLQADLVVVPLRYGSGTRIKILEAFAHRIPVVSTAIGAEGLDVRDGQHLLLATSTQGFVAACERLLTDIPLRERLTSSAAQLHEENYVWEKIEPRISHLARAVSQGESP